MSKKFLIILFCACLSLILFGFVGQGKRETVNKKNGETKHSLKGLRDSYHDHCKKRCKVLLMKCLGERMSNTHSDISSSDSSKKRPNPRSNGNPERNVNCRDKCIETLRSCRCSQGDDNCLSSCQDNFISCVDKCGPYPFRELCGKKYLSCVDKCSNIPECFIDLDCGNDYICRSHRCISAPRCTSDQSCPRTDDYICYEGRCILF